MTNNAQQNLLDLVKSGPIYIAGNDDDSSIEQRIEELRAKNQENKESVGSCNMGWGWGN